MRVGVLALQGDWEAHGRALREIDVESLAVRTARELALVNALVLPGGESTAMLRLAESDRLTQKIAERVREGMAVLGTCAGVILLASHVDPVQPSLQLLDVDVVRNAYGRQVYSDVAEVELDSELGEPRRTEGVFIRAPRIVRTGPAVRVLGRRDGDPVLVRQGRIVAATYHPELTDDRRVHSLFCQLWEGRNE
jgi:5'-phosphate synthase pdxT subunit